jgi:hypothetical protein
MILERFAQSFQRLGAGSITLADAITMNNPSKPMICQSGREDLSSFRCFFWYWCINTKVGVGSISVAPALPKASKCWSLLETESEWQSRSPSPGSRSCPHPVRIIHSHHMPLPEPGIPPLEPMFHLQNADPISRDRNSCRDQIPITTSFQRFCGSRIVTWMLAIGK